MESRNNHITDFLNYYVKLEHPPEYAIMLTGPWGCGKTWLINNYREELNKQGIKNIYVSLYGLSSFSEIENEFFNQLHPILSSKGMAITAKVLRGLLKAGLKIDLTEGGADEVIASSEVPKLNIPKYLLNTENHVLIFDDLERSSFKIEKLLGYINHFVEHQGYKVIIICNEEELINTFLKNKKRSKKYKIIKEKLIGKTFTVSEEKDNALSSFLQTVNTSDVKSFLEDKRNLILHIYERSKYKNLRHIKHVLWEFERFYLLLPEFSKTNNEFLVYILQTLFVFLLEIRQGNITPSDIHKLVEAFIVGTLQKNNKKQKLSDLFKKYDIFDPWDLVPVEDCWREFFEKGTISNNILEPSISHSRFFAEENQPDWVKLWHLYSITDEEFTNLLESVETDFHGKTFLELGEIKHIVGMLMNYVNYGLVNSTIKEIQKEALSYIDEMKKNGKLPPTSRFKDVENQLESYAGLKYQGLKIPEFRKVLDYIDNERAQVRVDQMPQVGLDLLETMKVDFSKFHQTVTYGETDGEQYRDRPIFNFIPVADFIKAYFDLEPDKRRQIMSLFMERYEPSNINAQLVDELDWIKELATALEKERDSRESTVTGWIIGRLLDDAINPSIQRLEGVVP